VVVVEGKIMNREFLISAKFDAPLSLAPGFSRVSAMLNLKETVSTVSWMRSEPSNNQ
jgi:hypothetical protein